MKLTFKHIVLFLLTFILVNISQIYAQSGRDRLFEEVEVTLNLAQSDAAFILCPENYYEALEHYNLAKELENEGALSSDIRIELETAIFYITKMNDNIDSNLETFSSVIELRQIAMDAGAPKFAEAYWNSAEENLKSAIDYHADEDLEDVEELLPFIITDYEKAREYGEYGTKLVTNWAPLVSADNSLANLLSPIAYSEGMNLMQTILDYISSGDDKKEITELTDEASKYFKTASANAISFADKYPELLDSRKSSSEAGAEIFAVQLWNLGEEELKNAGEAFELNEFEDAVEFTTQAELNYFAAYKLALKNNLLHDAWNIQQECYDQDAEDYAPDSFERCNSLIMAAVNILDKDISQYNTARGLVSDAESEGRNALRITEIIKSVESGSTSWEALLLGWGIVGDGIEVVADRDYGQDIIPVEPYEEEESKGFTNLPSAMYDLFRPDEAVIIENENEITIRFTGIEFTVLGSVLNDEAKIILNKSIPILNLYPSADVSIASHTDYIATRNLNREVSEKRSESVRRYLMTRSVVNPSRMTPIGYGEDQPITSDTTAEGRKMNRRIEITIAL